MIHFIRSYTTKFKNDQELINIYSLRINYKSISREKLLSPSRNWFGSDSTTAGKCYLTGGILKRIARYHSGTTTQRKGQGTIKTSDSKATILFPAYAIARRCASRTCAVLQGFTCSAPCGSLWNKKGIPFRSKAGRKNAEHRNPTNPTRDGNTSPCNFLRIEGTNLYILLKTTLLI